MLKIIILHPYRSATNRCYYIGPSIIERSGTSTSTGRRANCGWYGRTSIVNNNIEYNTNKNISTTNRMILVTMTTTTTTMNNSGSKNDEGITSTNNTNNNDNNTNDKNNTNNNNNNNDEQNKTNCIISKIMLLLPNSKNDFSTTKDEIYNKRKKYFSNSVSISYENTNPLMIMKGRGSKLYDENNVEYLDTRNNVAHCGHCHPSIVQAIQEQVATLNTNTRYLHPYVCTLAEQLLELFPKTSSTTQLSKVFFVNSGSEANDLALRLATACTKNNCQNTIVVDGAYHGHTISTIEISPYKYEPQRSSDNDIRTECPLYQQNNATIQFTSPGDHIWKVPCPDIYRGIHRDPNTAGSDYATYVKEACDYYTNKTNTTSNDTATADTTATATNRPPTAVRAFIIEGGMSVGGVIIPPVGYIKECVIAVRNAGGLYIADEVQTGFGRLGSCMWAFQASQQSNGDDDEEIIIPDIVTVGKPFGNGMALGAVITTQAVVDAFEENNVEYFNTFGGNPVSAVAGLAMLHVLRDEQLQQNADTVGTYLKSNLLQLQQTLIINSSNNNGTSSSSCPCYIGDVRGSGLFIGIDFVYDVTTREAATLETSFICSTLKSKYHILSSIDGPYHNVLVIKPPLVFSIADANYFIESLRQILQHDLYDAPINATSHTPT